MKLKKIGILVFAYNRSPIALEDCKITSNINLIIDGPKNLGDKVNQSMVLILTIQK